MTLGDIIKNYRKSHSMSMDLFAEKSGISKAYISLLEKNKHPKTGKPIAPSIQCIKQAAEGMNMDFNVLFGMIDGNVSLIDEKTDTNNSHYYLNDETREIAQEVFEKPELRSLFHVARDIPPERLKAHIEFMKSLKEQEQ